MGTSAYTARGGVPTVVAANRVQWLAESVELTDLGGGVSDDLQDMVDDPDNDEAALGEPALAA